MSFDDFAAATVGRNYCILKFWLMTKSEAANRTNNVNLREKRGQL